MPALPRLARPEQQPDEQRPAWWVPRVLAAATATTVVIGGISWAADRDRPAPPTDGAVDETRSVGATGGQEEPRDLAVTTYAVARGGTLLFADRHLVEDATGDDVQVAVQQLVSRQVVDDDLAPGWPEVEARVATRVGSDRVTVDLAGLDTDADVGRAQAATALQALVWTVDTATRSRLPVEVLLDGAPADALWGVPLGDPVVAEDGAVSRVLVDSPADGAVVSSAFTVRGWARSEDGRLAWRLVDDEEVVVREGTAEAERPGEVAAYDFDVSSPVGDFILVVSLAGGSRETKRLQVR
ncbi:Gmad2 immunoglobulin-like domain-containing protein [Nocardioides aurantiacus]|uniref:Immunoglobulin-like protein involved in spore germination n=1 Tax=Nocardioides aurantiacus TaxID=86796 RepID=A0A3N2CSG3_9ACTN|nr:Gmad2 immunoglobulin-like domain-containing protein [Nocardioides aurantiacus]ROR90308.1 immunoglobulin-like protein involved in spore germination [Nocardioides aurantiacus]